MFYYNYYFASLSSHTLNTEWRQTTAHSGQLDRENITLWHCVRISTEAWWPWTLTLLFQNGSIQLLWKSVYQTFCDFPFMKYKRLRDRQTDRQTDGWRCCCSYCTNSYCRSCANVTAMCLDDGRVDVMWFVRQQLGGATVWQLARFDTWRRWRHSHVTCDWHCVTDVWLDSRRASCEVFT